MKSVLIIVALIAGNSLGMAQQQSAPSESEIRVMQQECKFRKLKAPSNGSDYVTGWQWCTKIDDAITNINKKRTEEMENGRKQMEDRAKLIK